MIYTHSHVDHFGGVKGVVDEADAAPGKVKVFAPDHFMDFAVAENIIAGNAMSRRAQYLFGSTLPAGERGQVDTGLGKALSRGTAVADPAERSDQAELRNPHDRRRRDRVPSGAGLGGARAR